MLQDMAFFHKLVVHFGAFHVFTCSLSKMKQEQTIIVGFNLYKSVLGVISIFCALLYLHCPLAVEGILF